MEESEQSKEADVRAELGRGRQREVTGARRYRTL